MADPSSPVPPPSSPVPSFSASSAAVGPSESTVPVPFVDLGVQYRQVKAELDAAVFGTLEKGDFINGAHCKEFEKELAASVGTKYAVGMASCTAATVLALKALGIGPGDEVITTTQTYIATVEAIVTAGAEPRLVDIQPHTHLIDPAAVEAAITSRTRAVIPVHLYGTPCDMEALGGIARRRGLAIVEDCAQSQGTELNGRPTGSFGCASVFSFFPSKNLGAAGDAGALCTDDPDIARLARMMANHGRQEKFTHEVEGGNHRLDTLQAGILRVKLKYLSEWNESRRNAAALYRHLLAGCPGLELPFDPGGDTRVAWHVFAIRVDDPQSLAAELKKRGIGTGFHYPMPVHVQPVMARLGLGPGSLPHAERYCARALSLPMFAGITEDQVRRSAAAVRASLGG